MMNFIKYYVILGSFLELHYVVFCVNLGFQSNSNDKLEIGFKKEYCTPDSNDDISNYKKRDYVNPNDMLNYNHVSKTMSSSNYPRKSNFKDCEHCAAYMQRFVGVFLSATGLNDHVISRSRLTYINLNLVIEESQVEILQSFVESGKGDLIKIDKTLTDIFSMTAEELSQLKKDSKDDSFKSRFIDFIEVVVKPLLLFFGQLLFDHPQIFIAICVASVFAITLWQIITTHNYKLMIFSLLFIIFGSGFGWNWFRLYKIADAKRFASIKLNAGNIPIYCRPDSMTWYQYIYYYSYEKDCEEYYQKAMIDPLVDVSPTIVLAETISMFILHPSDKIGAAIGNFIKGLLDAVPWPYKLFFVPAILILVGIFIIIISIILVGGRITLRVPFIGFEIGPASRNNEVRSIHHSVNRQVNDRELIEDIPSPAVLQSTPLSSSSTSNTNEGVKINDNDIEHDSSIVKAKNEIKSLVKRMKENSDLSEELQSNENNLIRRKLIGKDDRTLHLHVHIPKCSGDYCENDKEVRDKSIDNISDISDNNEKKKK